MVTLSRFTIDGNLGFPYMVTLDRVTIYRKILLFFFFSTANLSKLGPLRPIPSGKTSVPFVEPSELTTMGFFRESVASTYFRKFCRNNKNEKKKKKKKTKKKKIINTVATSEFFDVSNLKRGTILTWQTVPRQNCPRFFFFFLKKKNSFKKERRPFFFNINY
jgi:hypothetical protein